MKDNNLEKLLPGLKEDVLLKDHTTFRIGGPAKYFFIAKTKEDLIKAIKTAQENNLRFFILGQGSNLLVSDKGFNGLVIKVASNYSSINKSSCSLNKEEAKIYAEAGILLSQLVQTSIKNNLTGLEWAIGIPGTIGGAIYGNAGSFGSSISDIIVEVETLNNKLEIKKYSNQECQFGYRDSIFKNNKKVILSVVLKLKKGDFKKSPEKIKMIIKERSEKIPQGFSAGSIFKNSGDKSAGDLIEKSGLKGKKIGGAQISEKHANFIINLGDAKEEDILTLIVLIKRNIKDKFGIELEEEIQHLGLET